MKNFKNIFFSLLILGISSIFLSGCTTSEEKISQYNSIVSEADLLIDGREYNLAIEKLSFASELIPEKKEAFERIVEVFVTKNRLKDATKILDESAIKLSDKDRAELYVNVGDAYLGIKDFEKALYNYQLADGFDGSNQEASLGIAKVYIQNGNIEGARKLLDDKYEGQLYIESKLILSYIYSLTNIEEAKSVIQDIEPGDTWRNRYSLWNEVLDSLTSDELFNYAKLGKVYIDGGYPYLAIALLEPKKDSLDEYMDGTYILGKAYYEYGEYQKSIDILENSVSLSNLNQYIYWVLARDYYMLDNLDTAISYYDTAVSYGGDLSSEDLYMEYLDLLFDEKQTEKALSVMRNAERIFDREWIEIYYMRLYSLRRDNESLEYHMNRVNYENLSNIFKSEYLYSRCTYLISNNEYEEAQKSLDLFWELDKYDARYNYMVAMLHFKKGEMDEASEYSKKAIEYDTQSLITEDAEKLLAQID